MKAKSIIELLTLSSNLYLIAQDKEVMEHLTKLAKKGKDKLDHMMESPDGEGTEDTELLQKIINKAKVVREELEEKVEEIATKVYKKMHIAHTDDIKMLQAKIEALENRINLMEAHVLNLEGKK